MRGSQSPWWQSWLSPSILLPVAALLFGAAMAWASVCQHAKDDSIHHTIPQLETTFVRRDVDEQARRDLQARLAGIEKKLDRIADKVGVIP